MRFTGLLAFGVAVALTACSDTTQPPLTTDLSGSYNLQSIQRAGVTEPNSNGTLQLTTSNYDLELTVNGQIQPEDVGTYQIGNPDTWVQTSTSSGVQSIGTFTSVGSTLTVTLTTPQSLVLVWMKVAQQ